jgi:hypothetical protein
VDAIEVVYAKIFVVALVLLQVIANDYAGMCHRDDGSLLAAPRGKASELRGQVGVLGSRGSPGTSTSHAAQPWAPLTDCTAQTFAGTFVIAWAQRRPTGQPLSAGKLRMFSPTRLFASEQVRGGLAGTASLSAESETSFFLSHPRAKLSL